MSGTNKRTRKPGNKASRRAAYLKLRTEHPDAHASTLWAWTLSGLENKRKGLLDKLDESMSGEMHGRIQGFDICISSEPEEGFHIGDMGLGHFTDGAKIGDIPLGDREARERRTRRGEWTHYRPSQSFRERRAYFHGIGMSRHVAWLAAKEDEKRELVLAEEYASGDRCPSYVSVKVYRNGVKLGSSGIGMCDGDDDYLKQAVIEHGLIEEAIAEARETLAGLCGRGCKSRKGA